MTDPNVANPERRHSRALEPELIADPQRRAEAEALNGFRQYDMAVAAVETVLERKAFRLRPSLILGLHREALSGISSYAGNWRPGGVEIQNSKHTPVGAHLVPELVEDMCDRISDAWESESSLHLSAHAMWRLNWIHPFADGNGRISRVLSFIVLSAKLGIILPGTPTLPDLIVDHRGQYEDALDDADAAWAGGRLDVTAMEGLLDGLLAKQLATVYALAGGRTDV